MKIGENPVYFGYDIFGNMFGELDMDGEPITTYIYLGNHRLAMLGGTVTGSFGCNLGQKAVESAKANWAIIIILPVIIILALKYRKNKYVVSLLVVIGGSAIILIAMNEARSDLEYSEAIYYYHNDHLGTPQVMTNSSGTVVWDAAYQPFGKIQSYATQAITNRFSFPGQYEDDMTGMYYNHHRYYMPDLGRYNRSDPLQLNYYINSYSYAIQNPVIFIDPIGMSANSVLINSTPLSYYYLWRCMDRIYDYTMTTYRSRNEIFRHCYAACQIQKECGGILPSLVANMGHELRDLFWGSGVAQLRDILNGLWGSICSQPGRPAPGQNPSTCCTYNRDCSGCCNCIDTRGMGFTGD